MEPLAITIHYPVYTWNAHALSKLGVVCIRICLDAMWKVNHKELRLSCLLHAWCVGHQGFQQRKNILNMLAITLKVMRPLNVCLKYAIFKPILMEHLKHTKTESTHLIQLVILKELFSWKMMNQLLNLITPKLLKMRILMMIVWKEPAQMHILWKRMTGT